MLGKPPESVSFASKVRSSAPVMLVSNPQNVLRIVGCQNDRVFELFTAMLYSMSQALGYDFDEVQLKRDCYRPKGHGDIEEQQYLVRTGVVDLLTGKKSLPVQFTNIPTIVPPASEGNSSQSG